MGIKGPSSYIVRVPGNNRRFVHADHLINDDTRRASPDHVGTETPQSKSDTYVPVPDPVMDSSNPEAPPDHKQVEVCPPEPCTEE